MRASKSNGYRFFRMQNLCEFLPEDEGEVKLHFSPDLLTGACIPMSAVPQGETVISVDIAYSMSARADLTSIAIVRLHENAVGEKCVCVIDVDADRIRGSELAQKLALLTRRYNPRVVLLEQGPTSDSLRAQISIAAAKYETSVPVHFVQPSNAKGAKFLRIKDLELLLSAGRLKFASSAYVDALFAELQKLDGAVSSAKKKDDRADSIAQVATTFRIYASDTSDKKTPLQDEGEAERMQQQMLRKAHYESMFGPSPQAQKSAEPEASPQPERKTDPRLAQLAKCLPPGMRI